MEVSIDLDICCHLGFIKSIDILDRGFYYIEISLNYGSSSLPIAPVGCFSAASTLTSKVRQIEINESILLNVCHTNEAVNTFETRSFLVRYKDEVHELNEGCHWRLTLTNVDLTKQCDRNDTTILPHCIEDLSIKFVLYRSHAVSHESSRDIEVTCIDPEWEVVSDQQLIIQSASSGLHEYYPIRFKRYNFMNLDCMIHGAVTGIRLESVDLDKIMKCNSPMFKLPNNWCKEGLSRMYHFESSNTAKANIINTTDKFAIQDSTDSTVNATSQHELIKKRQALKLKHSINLQETQISQDLNRSRMLLKSKQQSSISSKVEIEESLNQIHIAEMSANMHEPNKVTETIVDSDIIDKDEEETELSNVVNDMPSINRSPSRKNDSMKPNLKRQSPMKGQPLSSSNGVNENAEEDSRLYQSYLLTSNQIFNNLTFPSDDASDETSGNNGVDNIINRELLSSSSVKRPKALNLPEELVDDSLIRDNRDDTGNRLANRRGIPTTTYSNNYDSNTPKNVDRKSFFNKIFRTNQKKAHSTQNTSTAAVKKTSNSTYKTEYINESSASQSLANPLYNSTFGDKDIQKPSASSKSTKSQSTGHALSSMSEARLDLVSMLKLGSDNVTTLDREDGRNGVQQMSTGESVAKDNNNNNTKSKAKVSFVSDSTMSSKINISDVYVDAAVTSVVSKNADGAIFQRSGSADLMQIVALWRNYTNCFVVNYYTLFSGMDYILGRSYSTIRSNQSQSQREQTSQWEKCPLELSEHLIKTLENLNCYPDFFDLLQLKIDKYCVFLSSRWSVFVTSLSQIMPMTVHKLRPVYFNKMEMFWKKQAFVHNCSLQYFLLPYVVSDPISKYSTEYNLKADSNTNGNGNGSNNSKSHHLPVQGYTEDEMFACLHSGYMVDADNSSYAATRMMAAATAPSRRAGNDIVSASRNLGAIPPLRHGKGLLRVIDHSLKDDSKLPVMFIQQYTSPRMSKVSFLPADNLIFRGGDIFAHNVQYISNDDDDDDDGEKSSNGSDNGNINGDNERKIESVPVSALSAVPKLYRANASLRLLTADSFKASDNGRTVTAAKKYSAYDVIDTALLCQTYARHSIASAINAIRGSNNVAFRGSDTVVDDMSLHFSSSSDSSSLFENAKQSEPDIATQLRNNLFILPNSTRQSLSSFNLNHQYQQQLVQHSLMTEPSHAPHLIILQHGFLGTHYCMRLIQNAIAADIPHNRNVYILAADKNDDHNDEGITAMAERLAEEIHQYCENKLPELLDTEETNQLGGGLEDLSGRVSFICHSMGGLVVRKALEHKLLKPLIGKLHTYISLATPHVGTSFADSQLVQAGTWALFKWKGSEALQQLNLQDTKYLSKEETVIYKLSNNGVLGRFNKVVLVSSPKDMYCPRYSAAVRMSLLPKNIPANRSKTVYYVKKMADNLLNQIDPDKLIRITLDNNEAGANAIDIGIGRAAHVCYLDNPAVASQLLHALLPLLL